MTTLREAAQQALALIQAQQEWINAVPKDTQLPTMPGYDMDWADGVVGNIHAALAQPESEPSDREAQIVLLRNIAADLNDGGQVWITATLITSVADMLEADAQQVKRWAARSGHWLQKAHEAQQVAVPQEPVAEVVECQINGQQTVKEINGSWKFLAYGTKLYVKEPT